MWNDGGNFGGGGFLESTFATPSAEEEKKVNDRRAENIVPVSIGQILRSEEEFRIGEVLVHVVSFVGKVVNVDTSSTKLNYLIEDYSGQIEALYWLENPLGSNQPTLNSYCRVSGTIRVTQGKRTVMIFNIYPITDMNELTAHLLEVIDVYQCAQNFTEGVLASGNVTSNATKTNNKALANSMMDMDDGLDQQAPSDPRQRLVYKAIASVGSSREEHGGVDVDFIYKYLNGRIPVDQVKDITDYLAHEGFIFSTIDDEHFTVTK